MAVRSAVQGPASGYDAGRAGTRSDEEAQMKNKSLAPALSWSLLVLGTSGSMVLGSSARPTSIAAGRVLDRGVAAALRLLGTHSRGVDALTFSEDGKRLASAGSWPPGGGDGGEIRVWDLTTGTLR